MREILFRGKLKSNAQWAYGNLQVKKSGVNIITPDDTPIGEYGQVDPSTVGQYTGLVDKNGKRIFEGDVVKSDNGRSSCTWVVRYGEYIPTMFYELVECFYGNRPDLPSFGLYGDVIGSDSHVIITKSGRLEVIGNIYDNPELLEEA